MTSYDNLTFINNNNFIGNDYLTKKFHENDKENKNNLNLKKNQTDKYSIEQISIKTEQIFING